MAKVLFLAPADQPHTLRWVNFALKRGHHVTVLTFHPAEILGVKVINLSLFPALGKLSYLISVPLIRRLLKQEAPDLVHAHYAISYGFLASLGKVGPLLLSVWGSDIYKAPKRLFSRTMVRRALAAADIVCATSFDLARETRLYLPPGKDVVITPFGVDINLFRPADELEMAPVVGTVRQLKPIYGLEYLLEAFAIVLKELPAARLVIVGDGYHRPFLEQLAREKNIENQVKFAGYIPNAEVTAYLQQMRLFVLPSLSESFGVAALEAQACGLPIIASRVGGLPEVIVDGRTGYLVPEANVAALADKILKFLLDDDLCSRMGREARRFVVEKYDIEKCEQEMEKCYNTLLK